MSVPITRELDIPFWFQDALSGEFHPPQDPHGNAHTMARLSMATFLKGTHYSKEPFPSEEIALASYSPSWAPDITSRIIYSFTPEVPAESASLLEVSLETMDVPTLSFGFNGINDRLFVENAADQRAQVLPLELGPPIVMAQRIVASTAELFFLNAATMHQQ